MFLVGLQMDLMRLSAAMCFLLLFGAAHSDEPPTAPVGKQVANVVARVDDKAIFLQDLIGGRARGQLELMSRQLSREEYRVQERMLLKGLAEDIIERNILLKEVDLRIKDQARLNSIRKDIGGDFKKMMMKQARAKGINDMESVEKQLEKEGTTYRAMREEFIDVQLANGYLHELLKKEIVEPSRNEILEYYQEHKEQFQQNASVVWRQIEVRVAAKPKEAAEKIFEAQQRLTKGEDFASVAKSLSDGPSAASGGLWPATSKGSYADPEVDRALFTIPVGRFSTILRGYNSFHIVKIESRTGHGAKPFEEVQKEIVKTLKEKQFEKLKKVKLAEIRRKHYVESVFDRPDETAARPGDSIR
jgi:parvulin-like peptidyl-prolyl isomerase